MKILELAKIRAGYCFRSKIEPHPEGNILLIQPKDLGSDGILRTPNLFRVEVPTLKPGQILREGDVLLTSRGKFISTVFSGLFKDRCVASGALLVLTLKTGAPILPEYFSLYFNAEKGQQALLRLTDPSTIPFLNRSSLEQMDIPVPDFETQQKLVSLERTKQRYAQLTERKQELLNKIINHQLI